MWNPFKKSEQKELTQGYQPKSLDMPIGPPPNQGTSGKKKAKKKTKPKAKKKPEPKKVKGDLTPKEQATLAGEPYVSITQIDLDPNNVGNGAVTLDWNDKFLVNLIKSGYKIREDDTEAQIVDRWFQTVCRNIALEVFEQEQADPTKRDTSDVRVIQSKDLGGGYTEIS